MRRAAQLAGLLCVVALCSCPPSREELPPGIDPSAKHVVDIGGAGDEVYLGEGFYHREGPSPKARIPIVQKHDFRWATNDFALKLPVFPRCHNEVTLHLYLNGGLRLRAGGWRKTIFGMGSGRAEYKVVIPRKVVGRAEQLTLHGSATRPRKPGGRDKRTLFVIVERLVVRPLAQLPPPDPVEKLMAESRDIAVLDRLRGIERRPPTGDREAFVERLVQEGANVVTMGTMNGLGYVFYPSKFGVPHPRMDPEWIPEVTKLLRRRGIRIFSWACFNIQDTRKVEDFVPARRFPQWQMKFIEEPGRKYPPRVGMCVVSSPYIEHHAKKLREMAAFDFDGFFFDGFYLGGLPHRSRPGCTCDFCKAAFKKDTGLELPTKVDWADMTFKRWVRWRNHRLLKTARYFQAEMKKVNPKLTVTFNYNLWPFGHKDWETAIPAWRIDDFGVSQHGYSGAFAEKWLLAGFKARLGRDINPQHTDMWRACGFQHTCGRGQPDLAWHELEITTFLLTALSHGITPWHSTIAGPIELTAKIHGEVAKRERYFSRDYVANVAVLYSQNTHDFYGHIPGTSNLADYRDGILGTWMALSEHHVPFEFIFDNQIEEGVPEGYDVLILPNAAALSQQAADHIGRWAGRGGHVVLTADSGAYDEWGRKLATPRFEGLLRMARGDAPIPSRFGHVAYLREDPGLAWCRRRSKKGAAALLKAVPRHARPFEVEAPNTLIVNMFRSPDQRELWVHLLNVSPFMPGGDSGFRGLERKAAQSRRIGGPLVPAQNVAFRLRGRRPRAARLVVAGRKLPIAADGSIVIPRVDLHDTLVLKLR